MIMVFIYILQLESQKYYIGKTDNPTFRLKSHFNAIGSVWTKKYKPIKIIKIIPNCDHFDEDKYTKIYMNKYGINNVRGGSFCQIKLNKSNQLTIEKELKSATDKCYICNESGHFANSCSNNKKLFIQECDNIDNNNNNDKELFIQECDNIDNNNNNDKELFIQECKKYRTDFNKKLHPKYILSCLQNIGYDDMKLTDIFDICQKINNYNHLQFIDNYHNKIKYIDFIDGFLYVLEYDNETSEESSEEIYTCQYCGKEFNTKKGTIYHENRFCKKKYTVKNTRTITNSWEESSHMNIGHKDGTIYDSEFGYIRPIKKKTLNCYRCGRKGHKSNKCYAKKHMKGYWIK